MRQARTWHRASLLIALSVVAACGAAVAANPTPDQTTHSFTYLLQPSHETWLGIEVQDVNPARAREFKLPGVYGALVVGVIDGSPAAKAGIEPNDVILEFAGERVRGVVQLHRLVEETPVGRTVSVRIIRKGKLQTLHVKVETRGPSALLEKPLNPQYRIWRWPAYKLPLQPPERHFLEPVPKGKIIPIPPVIPKYRIWRGPLYAIPKQPPQHHFLEPVPKPKVVPTPPFIPKFKPGPIPIPKAPELPQLKPFVVPAPKKKAIPLPPAVPYQGPFSERNNFLGITGYSLTPQLARFFGVKDRRGVLIGRVLPTALQARPD